MRSFDSRWYRKRACPRRAFLAVALIPIVSGAVVRANTITADAGMETSPDTPIFKELFEITEYENLTDLRLTHELHFRLGERTEMRVAVPTILHRRADFPGLFGNEDTETMSGLGDVKLRLMHSLWQTDDVIQSNRWSIIGEVTAPTGDDDQRGDGWVDMPRELQISDGGWGMGGGTVITFIRDRHRFSSEWMYRHRTRHDGYRAGDALHWNLAYWYRLFPAVFSDQSEEEFEIRGVIELLNTYNFESKTGDHHDGDHGLETWIAPSIQIFIKPRLLFDIGVQLPIIETVNDDKGDRQWAGLFAVRVLL